VRVIVLPCFGQEILLCEDTWPRFRQNTPFSRTQPCLARMKKPSKTEGLNLRHVLGCAAALFVRSFGQCLHDLIQRTFRIVEQAHHVA
jgi:hypothetical protein